MAKVIRYQVLIPTGNLEDIIKVLGKLGNIKETDPVKKFPYTSADLVGWAVRIHVKPENRYTTEERLEELKANGQIQNYKKTSRK